MSIVSEIQRQHWLWVSHNFPDQPLHRPLLGVVEEVGELAHAHLKQEQGIRLLEDHDAAARDAVGDILIYLLHYCSLRGWDLEGVLLDTWEGVVRKRDWVSGAEADL